MKAIRLVTVVLLAVLTWATPWSCADLEESAADDVSGMGGTGVGGYSRWVSGGCDCRGISLLA